MPEITESFKGLPMGLLICQPILEIAKGQAALCEVYLDFIFKLAFKSGKTEGGESVRTVTFNLQRPVTDNAGNMSKMDFSVEAPLLSLVPIPAFSMQEASVAFTMEVKETAVDKSSTDTKTEAESSFSFWGVKAKVSGSVATHRENTRTSDHSAKYEIHARASQQPPAEGMAKLTTIFASVIEPLEAAK